MNTVSLAPKNGLAWCRLGYSYEQTHELEQAATAYLNCCLNGDRGSNGCYGAGRVMEQLGNSTAGYCLLPSLPLGRGAESGG